MRRMVVIGLAVILAACGPSATRLSAGTATPRVTGLATTTPVAPTAAPTQPPHAAPPPPPVAAAAPAPPVMSSNFALLPVGGSGAFGSVSVTEGSGFFRATVVVHGVASGTLHTVHIHAGSCANPYGGMHLTVLGLLAGNSSNTGGFTAAIAPVYLSSGHYAVVYSTSSPIRIIACANL